LTISVIGEGELGQWLASQQQRDGAFDYETTKGYVQISKKWWYYLIRLLFLIGL